jgi:hypothetical protein
MVRPAAAMAREVGSARAVERSGAERGRGRKRSKSSALFWNRESKEIVTQARG